MFLVIDNYDSFTYNLVQYLGELSVEHEITKNLIVKRNDEITLDEIIKLNPSGILLSPGPGNPDQSGICLPILKKLSKNIPTLGVCLGHQALAQVFNLNLRNMNNVKHGEQSILTEVDDQEILFQNLKELIKVGHYHSWVIDENNNFEDWSITAKSKDLIMSISHKNLDLKGVQFHPESVLTPQGKKMLENWINS